MTSKPVYALYFELPVKPSKKAQLKRLRAIARLNPGNPRLANLRAALSQAEGK